MELFTAVIAKFGIGRIAAILGIGAGLAAVFVALSMGLAEPKALLYSNLDLKEAGSITQALDQAGVKYEIKGDGSTIMVPRDRVASTRLMLSGKGLPTAGSVGYEIFDSSNALGQTDFVQQLNRQRALEGELARTIRGLDGITAARVHLVLPKRQLFEEEAEQPSASVNIGVGGREPTAEQVRAMQNLVAGAVPNLKPDRVTVVDQHAKTLSGGDTATADAADGRKSEVEARIAKQVKNLVEGVVGAGKARVNVTADLELARVTVQEEKYDPDGQVILSESTTDEKSQEQQEAGASQASVAANIPGAAANGAGPQNTSGRQESTTNYVVSKTIRSETLEPGAVKRLSVAVAVDGVTAIGKDGKPGAYTPRSAAEMQQIKELVSSAVGFNQTRGDQLSVVNVRFPAPADTGGTAAASPLMGFDKNDIMRAAEVAVMAVVALLMMFFVARPLIRGAVGPKTPKTAQLVTSPDGEPLRVQGGDGGFQLALPQPAQNDIDSSMAKIDGQMKVSSVKRVAEFVDAHPEESVSIIRNWLHETG